MVVIFHIISALKIFQSLVMNKPTVTRACAMYDVFITPCYLLQIVITDASFSVYPGCISVAVTVTGGTDPLVR